MILVVFVNLFIWGTFSVGSNNEHRETHKQLFASYMNKNCFEAYLETRWKPQNFPDTGVLVELIELSY